MEILPSEYYGVIVNSNRKVAVAVKEAAMVVVVKLTAAIYEIHTTCKALDTCITLLSHSGGALGKLLTCLYFSFF